MDVAERRLIAAGGGANASRLLQPPGSALKPLVVAALIESGKLKASETLVCPRRLRIRGRSFDCIHPELASPVDARLALAYSCNCYVAHMAERFERGELARELERFGLGSLTGFFGGEEAAGRIRAAASVDEQRMQALGEAGVEVSAAGMAMAYRALARKMNGEAMRPIREGLSGAVEFGTAQKARAEGVEVAGKTGSAVNRAGEPVAWFSGFAPAEAPKAALAVMVAGRSGGADAAPAARRIFSAWAAGLL